MNIEISLEKSMDSAVRDMVDFYSAHKSRIEHELKLCQKGSLAKRKIKGHYYYYRIYRENGKVCSDYVGKNPGKEDFEEIEKRRKLIKELRVVDKALYSLGAGKRKSNIAEQHRFAVLERDGFRCVYCGRNPKEDGVKLNIDHVHPVSKGGRDSLSNYATSCEDCNQDKRAKIVKPAYMDQLFDLLVELTNHCLLYSRDEKWENKMIQIVNDARLLVGDDEKYSL